MQPIATLAADFIANWTLREQVAPLNDRYFTGDNMITPDAMKLLNEWLFNHIIGSDRKFGQFLNEIGTFQTPSYHP
jgi:hemerythrin